MGGNSNITSGQRERNTNVPWEKGIDLRFEPIIFIPQQNEHIHLEAEILVWKSKEISIDKQMCKSSLIDNVDKNIQRAQRIKKKQKYDKDLAKMN